MNQFKQLILGSAVISFGFSGAAQAASLVHYWDFDSLSAGAPVDLAGGVPTSNVNSPDISTSGTYGEAYGGSGNSLNTVLATSGWVRADVHNGASATAMDFGTGDFAFSYWSYDASNLDGDVRGPRVFDSLSGTTEGLQLGTNATGIFNYRTDDDAGIAIISNTSGAPGFDTLNQLNGSWVHVAVNVSRTGNNAEVFFNGVTQGSYALGLTGNVLPSQDLQIGVINANFTTGATAVGGAQQAGLDDLAFYTGTLSAQDLTDLASGVRPDRLGGVPEPTSGLLALVAGLALALRRRRS